MEGLMKKFGLLFSVVILFLINIPVQGQANDDYRTVLSGNWNVNTTWERYNAFSGTWQAVTGVDPLTIPNSGDNVITILGGHTVTVIANVTVDQVVVNSGGTLESTANLTINNGTGTDLVVLGTCHINNGTLSIGAGSEVQIFGTVRVSQGSGSFNAGAKLFTLI